MLTQTRRRRQELRQAIARKIEEGESKLEIAMDLDLRPVTVQRLAPNPRRQKHDPAVAYRPPMDHGLRDALGMCPRCGRLKILPCSACDPDQ